MASPRPDGLRLRQRRDALVIEVLPHRSRARRAWAVGWLGVAALGLLAAGPGGRPALFAAGALWVACGLWWWWAHRRGRQRLLVYVGRRALELVWSLDGQEVSRERVALRGVRGVRLEGLGVRVDGDEPLWLPMEAHTEEARAWMVEHLRGAGMGAVRRQGPASSGPSSGESGTA